jgi:beta-glucuronidase
VVAVSLKKEIGFRTLEVLGDEILLNGKPIFLRGISLHEEAAGGRRAYSAEDARTLLGWASDLECNFVRLAHYPHNDHMAREADRLGLLVWAEIPVYWDVAFESEHTLELARAQLSELIERDRNRASVVIWSVGNETPMTESRLHFMSALVDHVRALDDTRLVSAALLTGTEALTPFMTRAYLPALFGLVRDELAERVDLAAMNEYFGWYYSGAIGTLGPFSSQHARRVMLENMQRIRFELPAGKPLVVSELGAGAVAGRHAPEEELAVYSEEYQALVYRRQLAMLEQQPGLRGISPWVLKDFRSPMRMYQGVQDYWNRKGLVADDGTRKQAFGVLRDHYRQRRALADGPS